MSLKNTITSAIGKTFGALDSLAIEYSYTHTARQKISGIFQDNVVTVNARGFFVDHRNDDESFLSGVNKNIAKGQGLLICKASDFSVLPKVSGEVTIQSTGIVWSVGSVEINDFAYTMTLLK